MHIAGLAADEGFINFNLTAQFASEGFILHSQTNAVQHKPCGFLGDIKIAGEFAATDAILAIREQPQGGEPLIKADSGILAYTPNLHGELPLGATGWPLLDLTVKPLQKALPPALSNLLRPNLKLFLRGFWTANV